ncbi:MAG: 50S ribosomal protein L23 [Candidatus Aminicenantes bacterium]|uniref:Large ribosomal subunit protein uL23 n=1 Tax=Candidatus Saccharicenans subterraneus TaxID=2508984 RepID=A0A3E2BMQ4_9BACT|nr:50S ribosomal protein L23 [Candidatus Aminicenantes bacterium]RFT15917.1 MAG: LSU ribosomal protein L23p (L23Ae) [Candidatus Saccharicenans subterraneum]
MTKDPRDIILRPLITEKSTRLKESHREVCFEVAPEANKIEVKKAVEELFKVKVERVTIVNLQGKTKRLGRTLGRTKDRRKAYVKLRPGEKMIEYFEAV